MAIMRTNGSHSAHYHIEIVRKKQKTRKFCVSCHLMTGHHFEIKIKACCIYLANINKSVNSGKEEQLTSR
jgi:hypothetical protein